MWSVYVALIRFRNIELLKFNFKEYIYALINMHWSEKCIEKFKGICLQEGIK